MPYATVTDLQDRLGLPALVQLSDLTDPPTGAVNATVVQKALDDASAEIDGYLVGRYPLPMPVAVPALRVHCVTIAHYRLLGNRADDVIREDVKAARAFLDRVSSGTVNLTAPVDTPPLAGVGAVLFNPGSKVMGRDSDGFCGDRSRGFGWV